METILEFFEPTKGFNIWLGKFILITVGSYLVVWILALILCRVRWIAANDNQLRIHFAWMVPFILHLILSGVVIIFTAIHFKQLGISLGYSIPYMLLILISWNCAYTLNSKAKERIKKLERRLRE